MKKLIPAFALLLVSAVLLSTASFAWFSMNRTVTATNMQVKAKAEAGLVISNAADGTYNISASSVKSTVAELKPGSTSDLTNWFHSTSTNPGVANTQQVYDAGIEWVDNNHDAHYVVHDFYIRSSGATALAMQSLDVSKVEAKVGDAAAAQNLSKALRVGVKIGNEIKIYQPIGTPGTYSVTTATGAYAAGNMTNVTSVSGTTVFNATGTTSVPANTDPGTNVKVYIWFEGEDENCISDNIESVLEQLDVTVTFTYTDPT